MLLTACFETIDAIDSNHSNDSIDTIGSINREEAGTDHASYYAFNTNR